MPEMTVLTERTGGAAAPGRLDSIDLVRGAIMVLMALDHVRFFFTDVSGYQPETLASTSLPLFLTRWVTHFCAPGFFLLAGVAISLYGAKLDDGRELRKYLLSRGLLLAVLEFTIVGYAWVFTPGYSFGGVIWSLGASFLAMAALTMLDRRTLFAGAVLFLVLHNALFDGIATPDGKWTGFLWTMLYRPGPTTLPIGGGGYFFLFPVVPWLAMMVLGYALGPVFRWVPARRRRVLAIAGATMIAGFVVLRVIGSFGNPGALWISPSTPGGFSLQQDAASTVISFLNTEKYPPSLQFTLMTLGPILAWLGLTRIDLPDRPPNPLSRALVLFGRVPLFYYLCHLYAIHLLALAVTTIVGQPHDWIAFGADPAARRPAGYGFGLAGVYLAWATVVLLLYALCRRYAEFKRTHDYSWLKLL